MKYGNGIDNYRFDPLKQQPFNPTIEDRLGAVGMDMAGAERYADDRNFIQRALNLQRSGLIGGIFETLGRPRDAVVSGLEKITQMDTSGRDMSNFGLQDILAQQEKDDKGLVTSIWDGLSGKNKASGGQVVRNLFQQGKLEDGSFDWTDVAGFGVEVLADPMSWLGFKNPKAMQAVTKEADLINKAASGIDDVAAQAGKLTAKSGQKAWDNIVKQATEATGKFDDLAANLNQVKNASKLKNVDAMQVAMEGMSETAKLKSAKMAAYQSNLPRNISHRSANQVIFDKISDTVKPFANWRDGRQAQKITDGITKFVGEEGAKQVGDAVGNITKSTSGVMDDITRSGTELYEKGDQARQAVETIQRQAVPQLQEFNKYIDDVFENSQAIKDLGFKSKDEFEKKLFNLYEYANLESPQMTFKTLVDDVVKGKTKLLPADNELIKSLSTNLTEGGFKPSDAFNIVKQDGASYVKFKPDFFGPENRHDLIGMLNKGVDGSALDTIGDKMIDIGKGYTNKEIKAFEKLLENPEIKELVGVVDSQVKNVQDIIGNNIYGYDHRLLDLSQEGYIPHTLNPDIKDMYKEVRESTMARGRDENYNVFKEAVFGPGYNAPLKERKLPFSAEVANRLNKESYREILDNPEFVERVFKDNKDGYELFKTTVENQDLFTQDFTTTFSDLLTNKAPAMANQKKRADMVDGLIKGMQEGKKGMRGSIDFVAPNSSIHKNQVRLSSSDLNKLSKNLQYTEAYTGGGSKYLKNTINEIAGATGRNAKKDIVMDKNVYNLVFGGVRSDSDELLGYFDKVMGEWKGWAVTHPAHLPKNEFQNLTNQITAGLSPKDIMSGRKQASSMMKKFEANDGELFEKLIKDGVTGFKQGSPERAFAEAYVNINGGVLQDDIYSRLIGVDSAHALKKQGVAGKDIIGQVAETVKEGPKTPMKTFKSWQMDANNRADMVYRISTHMAAENNPGLYLKLGLDSPAELSKLVHFDPNDLSFFERSTLKRIFPFYTMKKKNIEFHLANIPKNIDKYARYTHLTDYLWQSIGVEGDDRADYEVDGGYLPSIKTLLDRSIGGKTSADSDVRSMKWEAPFADLDQLTTPKGAAQDLLSSLNPILKGGVELATGRDTFTGKPIESYKGEASDNVLFKTKKGEKVASSFIGSGVTRAADNLYKAAEGIATGKEKDDIIDDIINIMNISYKKDLEKSREYQKKDFDRAMNDYTRYLRDQKGIEVPTANDLKRNKKEYDDLFKRIKKQLK